MANEKHVAILKQGVEVWNKWRKDNPDEMPNLSHTDLSGTDLKEINFEGAFLFNVNFKKTNLTLATFTEAYLEKAMLQGANISWTWFTNTQVNDVKFDTSMVCRGATFNGCHGSQRFVRHVMDLDYLEEFEENHPNWYFWWHLTSKCGRSWARFSCCCMIIIAFFGAVLYHFDNVDHPFLTSVFSFSSFGFIDSTNRDFLELFVLALESLVGFIMFGCLVSLVATKMARRSG
nr:pentapeptide repeat-containing protein [uncultured Pseudodesulfovibrio sp.]